MQSIKLKKIIKEGIIIKKLFFEKMLAIKQGHPGSILSIFEIVNMLYLGKFVKTTRIEKKNDILIMSKGHALSCQYPYLVKFGLIKKKEWNNWGKKKSIFRIFGNSSIPGIAVTSGSLGHGLGIAAGIALSLKKNKSKRKVYVIVSEGELYEGSTWEQLLFIAHNKLDNIKIILDRNNLIILGNTETNLKLNPIDKKFKSFNFKTKTIDGHNYKQILKGLNFLEKKDGKPKILIANTVKGNSISFMKNKPEWHYFQNMSNQQIKSIKKEI